LPSGPSVTAVVLAYGDEPVLVQAVDAILSSRGVDVDVIVVDNGCTTDAVEQLASRPAVTVMRPGRNTGFAAGCNLGASHAEGDLLAFINGDAVVSRDALHHLAKAAAEQEVGLASASLRLYDRPDIMNSAGNPVHYTGLSWAGGLGEHADQHARGRPIASVSGAAVVVRRELFTELGGFCSVMFAYCEDAELSLRCWQRGLACRYVPEAVVLHRYEFSRNPLKMYLLERNRLILLMTLFERRTLALLAPALVALEAAMLAVAIRQGWACQKLAGWVWLVSHRHEVRQRRAYVQATRTRGERTVAARLTGDFNPGAETGLAAPAVLRRGSRAYWWLVTRCLSST
jgi:GT2 family glycosyltransferase